MDTNTKCWHRFKATPKGLVCDKCGFKLPLISTFPVVLPILVSQGTENPPV